MWDEEPEATCSQEGGWASRRMQRMDLGCKAEGGEKRAGGGWQGAVSG